MLRILLLSTFLIGTFSNPAGQSVVLKDDGSYHFSFDTGEDAGHHAREEVRQPDGTVIGKYSYKDDTGAFRSVSYRAGRQGFIASGDVGAVGSPPAQVPAKIPDVPPEVPEVPETVTPTTLNPVPEEHHHHHHHHHSSTENPVPSDVPPKEVDDEEAHAPPVNPSEEESPSPFPAPPFGKRRMGDEPIKPDDQDTSAPVDPSSYFYSYGHSFGPQYFSKTPGQVSFSHGTPAVQPFYSAPNYVRNPSHPFYAPGTVSGLTNHAFYAPGTSAPQAPVWNYYPQQQEQPVVKADTQGEEHPGAFNVPPYWKRRLQDPNEAKEEDEALREDAKEPSGEILRNKFNSGSPLYPTLIRTSFVPHQHTPQEKKPAPAPVAPKAKVVSRFFIYVPTSQGVPYWGYGPSKTGNDFKYMVAKPAEKYTPSSYGQDYWSYNQPQYIPHNQYSGPWNYMPQTYMPQQQAPWSFFSRAIPVTPTVEKKSIEPTSYVQEHSRPAVQHYAYKGPSNTYGYFYQY